MRTRSKLALIGLGTTLIMAFAIGTASARNLSISNQNIRMTFNNLELGVEGFSTTSCRVTLEGSFHSRTLRKTPETLVGFLTRVTTGNCNNPVTPLTATLPWHVRYSGFSGRLPNITAIIAKIINIGASVEVGIGTNCLGGGNVSLSAIRNSATGELTGVEVPLQTLEITGFLCPASGFFHSAGIGSIMLLATTARLTVTLI